MNDLDAELLSICLSFLREFTLPAKFVCKKWYSLCKTYKMQSFMIAIGWSFPSTTLLNWVGDRWMATKLALGAITAGDINAMDWYNKRMPIDGILYGAARSMRTIEWLESQRIPILPSGLEMSIVAGNRFATNWLQSKFMLPPFVIAMYAARCGNVEMVLEFLPNKADRSSREVLIAAIKNKNPAVFTRLFEYYGSTYINMTEILGAAASLDNVKLLEQLSSQPDMCYVSNMLIREAVRTNSMNVLNYLDNWGDLVLHSAIVDGNVSLVKYVLTKRHDAGIALFPGALLHAIRFNVTTEILRILIENGGVVQEVHFGMAVAERRYDVIEYLISKGYSHTKRITVSKIAIERDEIEEPVFAYRLMSTKVSYKKLMIKCAKLGVNVACETD